MKKKNYPLAKVYQLLEPGPVVLLTTNGKQGDNVMTMSWHMMIDFEPPLLGCIVSKRSLTFSRLKASKECVISIPGEELASQVVKIGNCSGRSVDKFQAFQLTKERASTVGAPLIAECFANLECKVVDMKMATKYNMFILEVTKAWMRPAKKKPKTLHHEGYGVFVCDGKRIKLPSKMK